MKDFWFSGRNSQVGFGLQQEAQEAAQRGGKWVVRVGTDHTRFQSEPWKTLDLMPKAIAALQGWVSVTGLYLERTH